MTRDDMVKAWEEIVRLRESTNQTDRVHALGLIDDLMDALKDKVLVVDEGHCLYEHEGEVFLAEFIR